jgi:two-component system, OmpR family, response regulator
MTSRADKSFHILVVDDDARICKLLNHYLTKEGYKVSTAVDGEQMRKLYRNDRPDLVILDLLLPNEDGLSLARELRANSNVGIIILTGKQDPVEKIVGLEMGADDFITKPFDDRELLARVRSVLRRVSQITVSESEDVRSVACFAGWSLNLNSQELMSPTNSTVHLTSYEFQLLSAFIDNVNRVLSRDRIMDLIAGRDWSPTDRTIDVLVGKLRKKLDNAAQETVLIKTVRGAGYKFTAHVRFE